MYINTHTHVPLEGILSLGGGFSLSSHANTFHCRFVSGKKNTNTSRHHCWDFKRNSMLEMLWEPSSCTLNVLDLLCCWWVSAWLSHQPALYLLYHTCPARYSPKSSPSHPCWCWEYSLQNLPSCLMPDWEAWPRYGITASAGKAWHRSHAVLCFPTFCLPNNILSFFFLFFFLIKGKKKVKKKYSSTEKASGGIKSLHEKKKNVQQHIRCSYAVQLFLK